MRRLTLGSRSLLLAALLSLLVFLSAAPGGFRLEKLPFVHRNSPTSQKYLIETMGGGVALFDYDNDGRLDVFLVNGGKLSDPQKLPVDYAREQPEYQNRLYRQNPDGSFTDTTAHAGLSRAGNHYGMGAAVGDYNNDGFADLYVTNFGRNALYRNNGDGTFTDITEESRAGGGGWSVSAGFLDYDSDGRLDLFVSRYLDWDVGRNLLCGKPFIAYCRPDKYEGMTNLLFRNEGGDRFRDVSDASGIASVRGKGMGIAVNDYNGDGFTDIFVSNDGMEQYLFRNSGKGTFEETALDVGVALADDGKSYAGMGVAFADFNNDGQPDIAVTNLALEKYALYRNDGKGRFSYASQSTGLSGLSARSSGWGVGMYDFDNDGWKDLFVSQSHVLDNVERIRPDLRYLEPPALFRNAAGRFERAAIGSLPAVAGRGAAFGDTDNNGAMDAVVSVLGGRPLILRNGAPAGHWLIFKLIGTRSNRDGAGAHVRVEGQWAYATTSGSYLSASDSRVHFGLGKQTKVDAEILWPSGRRQTLQGIEADRIVTVKEPE